MMSVSCTTAEIQRLYIHELAREDSGTGNADRIITAIISNTGLAELRLGANRGRTPLIMKGRVGRDLQPGFPAVAFHHCC